MSNPWSDWANKVNQGLGSVRQFAAEKLGTTDPECVTELPHEYVRQANKLEQIRRLYEKFLRLTAHFSDTDYHPSVAESAKDAVGKFNELVNRSSAMSPPSSTVEPTSPNDDIPKSIAHALSKTAGECALELGQNEPLGAALKKFSDSQLSLGHHRLQMEEDVMGKFTRPWSATLNTNIQTAVKAKKAVSTAKYNLEQAKVRMKNAKPERLPLAQAELTKSEEELNYAIKDATHKIHLVVDSPEPIRNLADLVNCQLAYYKHGYEILAQLAPDLDELQVTQEALFRSDN